MTIVEYLHRLGRHARGNDFTKLSMSEQSDLINAANEALQQSYNLLPQYYKEITEGFFLPGPQTVSVGVTQFSNIVTGIAFTDNQIGCTIVISGDPQWNQVIASDRLMNPYMGDTGTTNAQLYGDAWYSTRFPFDRVIGNPCFTNPNLGVLNWNWISNAGTPVVPWLFQNQVGQPCTWWTQMLGNSEGNEPLMVLRFAPAPNQNYSLRIRTSFWPKRITLANINSASTLVCPDQYLETVFIPLGLRALMSTPVWDSSKNDNDVVVASAERAEAFAKLQPGQNASPNNRVCTPRGY